VDRSERAEISLSREIAQLQRTLGESGRGIRSIATAESATAGRIADRLTDVAGASSYVTGGIVAYSNDAKMELLGVNSSTLSQFGAVSAEVAREMAEGGRHRLKADICVSDSGIAGPGGGTASKPVGLFYFATATPSNSRAYEFRFVGDRVSNKEAAVVAALTLLRDYLVECCETQE